MSKRATDEDLHAGIWPVEIESSSLGDAGEVILEVDDETGSTTMKAETWGIAGVASRPRDGSSALGYAKALRVQLGESVIVLATYDPRNMVACEPGEVCVFALGQDGASRALIRLKADGTIEMEGTGFEIPNGSTNAAARADLVDAEIGRIWDLLTGWTVAMGDGGGALKTAAGLAVVGVETTAATKVKIT